MGETLVLCYHAISETWPPQLAVRPDRFERQLEHVLERGYVATTFTEAVAAPPAPRTVAITFDDAYRSVYELGLPILERLGLRATVFAPTEQIGGDQPMAWPGIDEWLETEHRGELFGASWEQLAELGEAGWEIGSHTCTPRLPELDDLALAAELRRSREQIEDRLRRPCTSIAYPYGAVDARVTAAAKAAGYRTGAGLGSPFGRRPDPLDWSRVVVRRGETHGGLSPPHHAPVPALSWLALVASHRRRRSPRPGPATASWARLLSTAGRSLSRRRRARGRRSASAG